jgi:hypothetical protein
MSKQHRCCCRRKLSLFIATTALVLLGFELANASGTDVRMHVAVLVCMHVRTVGTAK